MKAPTGMQAEVDSLRAEVERLTAALHDAKEAVRLNELFVGILGHDLRNPMSAISMGTGLLMRSVTDPTDLKVARRIVSSTARMGRMIDQLLDFTLIRSGGGLVPHKEAVNLQQLVTQVIEELELARPEAEFALEVEGDDLSGQWDRGLLFQALSNLGANAVEHGTAGKKVQVQIVADAKGVGMTIHNRGTIPEMLMPELFDPFRGSAREGGGKGLGLGLYITQQIVHAHGGTLEVESTARGGTTFTVTLPR